MELKLAYFIKHCSKTKVVGKITKETLLIIDKEVKILIDMLLLGNIKSHKIALMT